ncbi:hypothetical protein J1614_006772 [Plenodomus biglobosus]|nr:hypothetical protein J1614_006772 [Plenodomus biglobosus]
MDLHWIIVSSLVVSLVTAALLWNQVKKKIPRRRRPDETRKRSPVFRVTGLLASQPIEGLHALLTDAINNNLIEEESRFSIHDMKVEVVPSCYNNEERVALVEFRDRVPAFLSGPTANPLGPRVVEMNNTDISFDQYFFGFTQLYTPKLDVRITADIIAITGLDGHAYGSWRSKGASRRMWLREFLRTDLPCCRTMIYGYNSKLSSDGIDTIMDYGRGLLEELKKVRNTKELRQRPLFFIAHSFGGLILAHCLVKAVQTNEDDHATIASLYNATYGMLLFGTPHKGLVVDDIQQMLSGQDKHPRSKLLQQIKSESDLLANQRVDFTNLIRDRKIVSFYETQQTKRLEFNSESRCWERTGTGLTAVDVGSALLELPDIIEDKIPLNADHSMMVKFDNKNEPGYTSARSKLQQFEQDALGVVAARFSRSNKSVGSFTVQSIVSKLSLVEHFVGRVEHIVEIGNALQCDGSRKTAVVHGLGGMGKTQLALAYAQRHKDKYSAVFWVNSKDVDTLKQGYTDAARRIDDLKAVAEGSDLDKVVEVVKQWLSSARNDRWLIIYDNYDTPKLPGHDEPGTFDIQPFLPEADHGAILITTRSSQLRVGRPVAVKKLTDIEHSLEILSQTSRRDGLSSDADARKLANKLDGLPLALATAGAYLCLVTDSFAEYLQSYEESWLQLQQDTPQLPSYEDRTLYTTWGISLDHVRQQSSLATKLLQLWAYFDSQDVWLQLLQEGRENAPEWFCELTQDRLVFNKAVRVLCDYALVEADAASRDGSLDSRGYSMHSCVHAWTKHVVNERWDGRMARIALKCVGLHVPSTSEPQYWVTQRRLLRHANRSWASIHAVLAGQEDNITMMGAVHGLGYLYAHHGKLDRAEEMYKRALQGYKKALGCDHTSTLSIINNLGSLYKKQGKLDRAEQMYGRALDGFEKALGRDHTPTLSVVNSLGMVNNLGVLYANQGKLERAEQMYRRALDGYEKALGRDHTLTLSTVNNLGVLYANQGKLDKAEPMYEQALKGREKALGLNHTSTLKMVNNLGVLYANQGKLERAEQMYRRALQGYEKRFGFDHSRCLRLRCSLAKLKDHVPPLPPPPTPPPGKIPRSKLRGAEVFGYFAQPSFPQQLRGSVDVFNSNFVLIPIAIGLNILRGNLIVITTTIASPSPSDSIAAVLVSSFISHHPHLSMR